MKGRGKLLFRLLLTGAVVGLLAVGGYAALKEMRSSDLQARYLSELTARMSYRLEKGPTDAVRYPQAGPYDIRLGYALLPQFAQRLRNQGFAVASQARFSPKLLEVAERGLFPPYPEKTQAGLSLVDRDGNPVYEAVYPARVYPAFDAIPPVILNTLLYIENRELLDEEHPHRNPAVEWDRLARASLDLVARKLGAGIHVPGGSTLATQIEKYRHSPEGRTDSAREKLRQMASAALRAYLGGADTTRARREIALTYLNSMPLAAIPGYGEVNGLGDGLAAWFGADFAAVNKLLGQATGLTGENLGTAQAQAYRQVLCLLLAQRRPSYYLLAGREDLEQLADQHLRLLANEHVIPAGLRDAALAERTRFNDKPQPVPARFYVDHKTQNVLRTRLAMSLGVKRLYDLDRLDASARATLDPRTQTAVTAALRRLSEPQAALDAGVMGFRLLDANNDLGDIVYSLVLYEQGPQGNLLRVQTDNQNDPLDISDGIRLDLGSTAKMRTMVHYLELIAALHQQYAGTPAKTLKSVELHPRDYLSRWVIDQLLAMPQIGLPDILEAALERRYSASPGEAFMTGGGLHVFANFNKDDNNRIMSVRRALEQSVNLVFIRLMRDVVYHHIYKPGGVGRWLDEDDAPRRTEYLERFADEEGKTYLRRFYRKYRDKGPQEALEILTKGVYPAPKRLATVYRSVNPAGSLAEFESYLKAHLPRGVLATSDIPKLYAKYAIDSFDLHDRGYIARVHPLELWLVAYLAKHPGAPLSQVNEASVFERQQVYRWLFKTNRQFAQNKRIRMLVEREGFAMVHQAWKRLGYPFESFTPSYASSIGAAGDRPAALAELMGILLSGGLRYPMNRFDTVHFAAATPYELEMALPQAEPKRVMLPEVAAAARKALTGVVENGTAVRVRGAYKLGGQALIIAGKTGTGDHRRRINGPGGRLLAEEVVSRTATFTFMLGDRHFGALTAYVKGPAASRFRFTSALPVQVLKSLSPTLIPMLARAETPTAPARQNALAAVSETGPAKAAAR